MPTYEYRCNACGHQFDEFQSITAPHLKKCPECGKNKLVRLIGIGAGIIFKGSGFYETDYRSDSYKKAAKAEKDGGSATSSTTSSSSSDNKTTTKSEPATAKAGDNGKAPSSSTKKTEPAAKK